GCSQLHQLQRLSKNRFVNIFLRGDHLHLRILHDHFLRERIVQCNVNIFVDRGGNNEACMLAIIRGQVGSASAEGDAERAAGDDQFPYSSYTFSTTRKAACASAIPAAGSRPSRMSSRNSRNSNSQESSPIGYSHVVV